MPVADIVHDRGFVASTQVQVFKPYKVRDILHAFFDEIQNIDSWEKFCRRMDDSGRHVFITGSNAKMLSREMEAVLGGRYMSTLVFPYSFPEYLDALHLAHGDEAMLTTKGTARILAAFDNYLHFGAFPGNIDTLDKREYVSSVYGKVLEGDVISRHKIRNPVSLRLMVKKLAETVKDTVSYNRLAASLKSIGLGINVQTVIDYYSYLEEAYLVFPVCHKIGKRTLSSSGWR